jgi:hypothetical protein
MYLKVALRMVTYRANIRSIGACELMAAVTAFPHLNFALAEYLRLFNIFE